MGVGGGVGGRISERRNEKHPASGPFSHKVLTLSVLPSVLTEPIRVSMTYAFYQNPALHPPTPPAPTPLLPYMIDRTWKCEKVVGYQ